MAATGGSSESATQYDVFLSFRGSDTRNTFTDCLYRTMVGQGIFPYRDSEALHAGDRIDGLLRAVGKSKTCIPVLSRGYASSTWCLRELARVRELDESTGKPEILPTFFDVMPSEVKLWKELYVEDLEKHEQRHGGEIRQQWEAALRKVGEIKGSEAQGKPYGEVIDLAVREVLRKLKVKQRPLDSKLVGVDKQVDAIMKLLDVDSGSGVPFVGIHGMRGIGKTTLAKIVFNELCPHFDRQCNFIGNIRESSNRNGLVDLQKQLVNDIFDSRFVENFINTNEGTNSIRRRASSKKVLIVLDYLDKKEQLKKLVRRPDAFGSGSRITITARNKHILDEKKGILPHEAKQMDDDIAPELFSLHAFNDVSPLDNHRILSQKVVFTTGGLPFALEVIGSYLRHQKEEIWKEMLEKLPCVQVLKKLKISYDALAFRNGALNEFRRRITPWQKGKPLGSGSFGSVYEGYANDGSLFAIKEVSSSCQGSQGKQSLEQEISLLSQLQHENIVRYLGTDKDDEKLYIFLELAVGSLETLYGRFKLSDYQVSAYTRQILNGLKYLHGENVVHRDIKCANILLDASGSVKLADFGLAKAIEMSDTKSCKGTPFWMAPEIIKGQSYGVAVDIWSLGCTVLEMLTGQHPYPLLEPVQAMFKICWGKLPPIPDSLSGDARDFILECLKVDPNERPSAVQLLDHPFVREPTTSSGFA